MCWYPKGLGKAWLGASCLGPSQEKARRSCSSKGLLGCPETGQKLRGQKLVLSHLRWLCWSSQIPAAGPEARLAALLSLLSSFALPVRACWC